MKFDIPFQGKNIGNSMRKFGYAPDKSGDAFSRSLRNSRFPKFHIYYTLGEGIVTLNLHLDQKQPSYQGNRAHSGEYKGALIEAEITRIKNITR
ncbi:hypothetical protein IIA94_00965 [Patescibacteria group bacterium]|nr:hypothetical protein [Patescibacteria group bacterium]